MKKALTLIGISLLMVLQSLAQNDETDNVIGTNHFIDSEILGERRQIQVYLPPNYNESDYKYPVLYLLDGQRFFGYAAGLSNTFTQFRLTPEYIIVGINTSYPQRFANFSTDRDKFIGFMEAEVLPYIEKSFRTTNERLLFGWEYGGSLGFNTMLKNTIPFDAYFLASPYPIKAKVDSLNNSLPPRTMLYFSVSPDEYEVNHGTDKLDSLLSSNKFPGLNWSYLKLLNEEHRSTGYSTLYHGLRAYFKYYPEFQEDNLQKFLDAGGLDYAYAHAKERGRKYGGSSGLSTWSKYTIIRSAIRADDYGHFETFANEFITTEFIRDLKNRASDIALFYEKNKKYTEAISIYETLLLEFPDSENLLKRIGDDYIEMGNDEVAQKYFQKATQISKSKN